MMMNKDGVQLHIDMLSEKNTLLKKQFSERKKDEDGIASSTPYGHVIRKKHSLEEAI